MYVCYFHRPETVASSRGLLYQQEVYNDVMPIELTPC